MLNSIKRFQVAKIIMLHLVGHSLVGVASIKAALSASSNERRLDLPTDKKAVAEAVSTKSYGPSASFAKSLEQAAQVLVPSEDLSVEDLVQTIDNSPCFIVQPDHFTEKHTRLFSKASGWAHLNIFNFFSDEQRVKSFFQTFERVAKTITTASEFGALSLWRRHSDSDDLYGMRAAMVEDFTPEGDNNCHSLFYLCYLAAACDEQNASNVVEILQGIQNEGYLEMDTVIGAPSPSDTLLMTFSKTDAFASVHVTDFLNGDFQDWISDTKPRVTFVRLDAQHSFVLVGDGNGNIVLQQQWGQSWSLEYWNDATTVTREGQKNFLGQAVEQRKQELRNRFGAYRSFRLNTSRGRLFQKALLGVAHYFFDRPALTQTAEPSTIEQEMSELEFDKAIVAVFGPPHHFEDGSKITFLSMACPWAATNQRWNPRNAMTADGVWNIKFY